MPSSSPSQARLMRVVAHNKAFAKKVDIPQNVGMEFTRADAAKKGSSMATKGKKPPFMGKESKELKMAKGGKAKCYAKGGGIEAKGKTKGRTIGSGKVMPSNTKC